MMISSIIFYRSSGNNPYCSYMQIQYLTRVSKSNLCDGESSPITLFTRFSFFFVIIFQFQVYQSLNRESTFSTLSRTLLRDSAYFNSPLWYDVLFYFYFIYLFFVTNTIECKKT